MLVMLLRDPLRRYDQLSPGIQVELPLKRIWVRVPETTSDEG